MRAFSRPAIPAMAMQNQWNHSSHLSPLTSRRLLDWWVSEARRHGVATQKVVSWIRRKMGGRISIVRYRCDGTLGCSVPCVLCQKELKRYDLHVYCTTGSGIVFSGRLTEEGAPPAALTAGQRRMWKRDKQ